MEMQELLRRKQAIEARQSELSGMKAQILPPPKKSLFSPNAAMLKRAGRIATRDYGKKIEGQQGEYERTLVDINNEIELLRQQELEGFSSGQLEGREPLNDFSLLPLPKKTETRKIKRGFFW